MIRKYTFLTLSTSAHLFPPQIHGLKTAFFTLPALRIFMQHTYAGSLFLPSSFLALCRCSYIMKRCDFSKRIKRYLRFPPAFNLFLVLTSYLIQLMNLKLIWKHFCGTHLFSRIYAMSFYCLRLFIQVDRMFLLQP